jgi:hypothetical protein
MSRRETSGGPSGSFFLAAGAAAVAGDAEEPFLAPGAAAAAPAGEAFLSPAAAAGAPAAPEAAPPSRS